MRIIEFDLYKELLKERSGLHLSADQSYLLESRLSPVAKKWGFLSLDAMTVALQGVPDKNLVHDIVEAMTTNETSFFRDVTPFDIFKDHVLPILIEKRAKEKEINIWCAGSSSGQEPYSLSMVLKEIEAPGFAKWRKTIKATDLSTEAIDQADEGLYSQLEVQRGLPVQMLVKHFTQEDGKWRISEDTKAIVEHKVFNLLKNMNKVGAFDVIFCRNVLCYFDDATKADVLERISKQLAPDGFLFLGKEETTIGLTDVFAPVKGKDGLFTLAT